MIILKSKQRKGGKAIAMLLCLFTFLPFYIHAQEKISLEGIWDFYQDNGKFQRPQHNYFSDYVSLPGSMLTNDKGNPVTVNTQWTGSLYDSSYYFNPYMERYRQEGQMKFPFFLTPERHYVGAAWYRRNVYVPEDWKDRRIILFLERPHIETTVFVNGEEVGHNMSLSTPHRYDITKHIKAGGRNTICIRVYNGIENVCVGQDSHSVTDQTQGNWNGIAGRIELQAQWKKLSVKHITIRPGHQVIKRVKGKVLRNDEGDVLPKNIKEDQRLRTLQVTVDLDNHLTSILPVWDYYCSASIAPLNDGAPGAIILKSEVEVKGREQVSFTFYLFDNIKMWDEFTPQLYRLYVHVGDELVEKDFGVRYVTIKDRQFYINERPLFLRGTVENCCFPETGYPPTDKESWLKVLKKCKDYGLNHVRFHSYCPPDAAFQAADELGVYLQPEGPSWPNHGVKLRRGQNIDQYLLEESRRIVDEYGHHPSFLMMAAGNEPAGDWVSYCNDWVKQMHQYDSTRVYCGASVGGGWAWDDGSQYHVKGGARGLDWDKRAPHSDDDYYDQIEYPRNYKPLTPSGTDGKGLPNQSPIIAHEQGQWCAFPDFKEIPQYTGVYKAKNFEIFRDLLRDNGMESQAENFLMASGKLQALCYKYEIERNLRTRDYAGFQLLSLNDYSGQGTALVGPLNVHWQEKGYTNAVEWRSFCGPLVSLARFPKFVYTNSDTLEVPIEGYNATFATLTGINLTYYIKNEKDSVCTQGVLPKPGKMPIGKNFPFGTIRFPLDSISAPQKLTLAVQISGRFQNTWDFWVYPEREKEIVNSEQFHITDSLDQRALDVLAKGGDVLLLAAGKIKLGSDVVQHYLPVFWNTSWFKMRPPHTTGAYIEKSHPLFRHGFPTDSWSNLNWWELLNRAQVMNLRELPADYQPPIQPIDTWHVSRKLGMLIEARVLKGRLLMTTMDLQTDLDRRIVARQMRHAILDYMQSADFQPQLTLQPEVITHFFTRQAPPVNMFTNDSPDELKPKLK